VSLRIRVNREGGGVKKNWIGPAAGLALAAPAGAADIPVKQHIRFGAEYLFVHLRDDDETFRSTFVPIPGSGTNALNSNFIVTAGEVTNHVARVRLSINN
jgi:hypothetical protein